MNENAIIMRRMEFELAVARIFLEAPHDQPVPLANGRADDIFGDRPNSSARTTRDIDFSQGQAAAFEAGTKTVECREEKGAAWSKNTQDFAEDALAVVFADGIDSIVAEQDQPEFAGGKAL